MPNIVITVDDETYDEIRKSDNRSKAVREAFAELRERRKHVCPDKTEAYFADNDKKFKGSWRQKFGDKWWNVDRGKGKYE